MQQMHSAVIEQSEANCLCLLEIGKDMGIQYWILDLDAIPIQLTNQRFQIR